MERLGGRKEMETYPIQFDMSTGAVLTQVWYR